MPATAETIPVPRSMEERARPVEEFPDTCAICDKPIDVRKPLAWSHRGKWVAHLRCYDDAWFTVGIDDELGTPEASS